MEEELSRNGNGQHAIDRDQLVAQYGWVRTVAKNLVRDPFGADDVAQETVLAALVAPPPDAPNVERLRAWLGRVAFNMSQLAARRSARRRTREERAAQNEALASAADHLAKVSLSEHVAGAVTELEEPYRTAVELRYFQGLSTADIARRTGTTDSAVRKRLWRARNQLRESLEETGSRGREHWLAGVIGFPASLRRLGAALRSLCSVPRIAGSTLALGLAATGWLVAGGRDGAVVPGSPGVEVAQAGAGISWGLAGAPGPEAGESVTDWGDRGARRPIVRERGPSLVVSVPPEPAKANGLWTLTGRVIDLQEHALGRLAIVDAARPEVTLGSSAADGSFRLEARLPVTLAVRGEGLASLREVRVEPGMEGWSHVLVAARAVDVSGAVVDEVGRPLDGASVSVVYDDSAFLDLQVPLDFSEIARASVRSDALGAFALERVPLGPPGRGIWLETSLPGYRTDRRPTSDLPRGLVVTLARSEQRGMLVRGVVHRPNGEPASGATVQLGTSMSRTDRRGAFELEVHGVLADAALVASEDGRAPVRLADFGKRLAQDGACEVELVLGEELEEIAGVLVDDESDPLADWWVAAFRSDCMDGGRGEPDALARTGTEGDFRISGLEHGAYALVAYDPRTQAVGTETPAYTGDGNVQVRVPAMMAVRRVAGTVTSDDGRALAGALLTCRSSIEVPSGTWRPSSQAIRADETGGFEFFVPAGAALQIQIDHPGIGSAQVAIGDSGAASCSFSVARASFLRVEDHLAQEFAILDESGRELLARGPASSAERFDLWEGRSVVVELPRGAHALRFLREGREVARTSVTALPGEIVVVRP